MTEFDAMNVDYKETNEWLRNSSEDVLVKNSCGQRFLAAGFTNKNITIEGTPGNALGSYLNGASITVHGNAQDAVGDTMNDGKIVIHGSIGDAAGYAMRGGEMYIKGDAGYRTGIHMKEYKDKCPVIVIGGKCGSFLGEYQAGGKIIVLGLTENKKEIVSNFPCTGMHGGKVFLRSSCENIDFPQYVKVSTLSGKDIEEIQKYILEFCLQFDIEKDSILNSVFTVVEPDNNNPYKQMYVAN